MSEAIEAAVASAGGKNRIVCPECGPERRKSNPTLSISEEENGWLYYCHHCTANGFVRRDRPDFDGPKAVTPVRLPEREDNSLVTRFLADRGIDRKRCMEYTVIGGQKWFRETQCEVPAVGFMYGTPGNVQAVKWRGVDDKAFTQEGAASTFWGLPQMPADQKDFIIVEGEMDVLALRMAGYHAVSVPNGAPQKVSQRRVDPSEDGKFSYVWEARDRIADAERVILAGDNDAQGEALHEELARRIDRARCWTVSWPDGCKDANDVLIQHGAEGLKECMESAHPMPLEGVYSASDIAPDVLELFEQGFVRGEPVGIESVDDIYSVLPGQLTVITGVPSSGKSEFVDQVTVNLAIQKGWRIAVASFENPVQFHIAKLAEKIVGRPFFEGPSERMTQAEMHDALGIINNHFVFLHHHDATAPSIRSILNRTKQAVMRMGVRGLVIDPFNYLDVEMDTESIRAMLRDVANFCKAHGIHVWFVAHPSKMYKDDQGNQRVPTGYDISGCYSYDTEVLTSDGWVPHPDVTKDHAVACFNPDTNEVEYHRPSVVHRYPFKGQMHHWTKAGLDLLVTPNHRMVVRPHWRSHTPLMNAPTRWGTGEWSFEESQNLPASRFDLPVCGNPQPGESTGIAEEMGFNPEHFWWYVGFWAAEGCLQQGGASVCQAEESSGVPRFVIEQMGLPVTERVTHYKVNEKPMWTSRVLVRKDASGISHWLSCNVGEGCSNKRVPAQLFSGSEEERRAFLDGFYFGDGTDKRNGIALCTSSKELADGLQRLAVSLGVWSNISTLPPALPHHKARYTVTLDARQFRTIEARRNLELVDYEGDVFCLTVPTGAYITRRNGRMIVCGNSAHWFNAADMGLTVHRSELGPELHCWKSRFKWIGRTGIALMGYDVPTGRFSDRRVVDRWAGPPLD